MKLPQGISVVSGALVVSAAMAFGASSSGQGGSGQDVVAGQGVANQQPPVELTERVAKLEERVAWLETTLGQLCAEDATLARINAEHTLTIAEERLQQSERLAAQGYLSSAQLKADRLAVEIAQRELQLAAAESQTDREAAHLAVLNAEAAVDQAQLRVDHSQRLLAKGYVSEAEFAQDQAALTRAQKVLEAAQLKLQVLMPDGEDQADGNADR